MGIGYFKYSFRKDSAVALPARWSICVAQVEDMVVVGAVCAAPNADVHQVCNAELSENANNSKANHQTTKSQL